MYKFLTGGKKSSILTSSPYTVIQYFAESNMTYRHLLDEAANEPDSLKRLALIACHQLTSDSHSNGSRKLAMIPLNQETFEMVLDDVKFFAESIDRDNNLHVMQMEGQNYIQYNHLGKLNFDMKVCQNGGTATFKFDQPVTYYLDKFDENIVTNKFELKIKNLFCGKQRNEKSGFLEVKNEKTGEKAVIEHLPVNDQNAKGTVRGEIFDSKGNKVYDFYGNIYDKLSIKKIFQEELWTMAPLIPKANLQYYMTEVGLMVNYINGDLRRQLPPTDTRLRPDLRLYEQGKFRGADFEKLRMIQAGEQRKKESKELSSSQSFKGSQTAGEQGHLKGRWFDECDHPTIKDAKIYKMKEGTGSYWERRQRKDWKNIAPLFN